MIVDDEPDAIEYLSTLISEKCPDLKIVSKAENFQDTVNNYLKNLPELIFLDIQLGEKSGFDLVNEIHKLKQKPYIIFVTAFNQFAIDAFKANAIDYLLKPVDEEDLTNAVEKFRNLRNNENHAIQVEKLIKQFPQKIRFNTRTGFILINSDDIIYCEADRNYTKIFTSPTEFELISHNLAYVAEKLPVGKFWRVSRSHLVNSDFVVSVDRKKKNCTLLWQNQEIVLSGSSDFLRQL
jgi:DNA-binding LytR/AlgR family response regulator